MQYQTPVRSGRDDPIPILDAAIRRGASFAINACGIECGVEPSIGADCLLDGFLNRRIVSHITMDVGAVAQLSQALLDQTPGIVIAIH